ncbi:trimethoprim-resistant dihydrofolate reductase DfrA [Enterobacter hormaechei]|nr:trimethoprim-resistant dihydrofolate reductase DfrA [Enterobacter hormaechei]
MKVSLMAAKAKNGVIGCGPDIPPVRERGAATFKALTYNQWLLVGRKTFESMGALPNRKYAVVTRSGWTSNDDNVVVFQSIEEAMDRLAEFTGHVIVSGGGEIYRETLPMASTLHLSTIDIEPEGDVFFPSIPNTFEVVFEQHFTSNINYCYQIWKKG